MNIKNDKNNTCAIVFDTKIEISDSLKPQLIQHIKELYKQRRITRFIVDMSVVSGVTAVECILGLSDEHPFFSVEAAIPGGSDFSHLEKEHLYLDLLNECSSKFFIVSDSREQYEQIFNRYIAHNAAVCVSISNTPDSPHVISVNAL